MLEIPMPLPGTRNVSTLYLSGSSLDHDLMQKAAGQLPDHFESAPDTRYFHRYQALMMSVRGCSDLLQPGIKDGAAGYYAARNVPEKSHGRRSGKSPCHTGAAGEKTALAVLSRLGTPDIHHLIREQFDTASCATDKSGRFQPVHGQFSRRFAPP